jgi:hypothetical protein
MKCESFLEYQRQMNSRQGKNNAQTFFGVLQIPSTPQIRNILDKISAQKLLVMFTWVYQALGGAENFLRLLQADLPYAQATYFR